MNTRSKKGSKPVKELKKKTSKQKTTSKTMEVIAELKSELKRDKKKFKKVERVVYNYDKEINKGFTVVDDLILAAVVTFIFNASFLIILLTKL